MGRYWPYMSASGDPEPGDPEPDTYLELWRLRRENEFLRLDAMKYRELWLRERRGDKEPTDA